MFVHHAYGHQFAAEMDRIRQRKSRFPRWILKAGWVGAQSTTRVKTYAIPYDPWYESRPWFSRPYRLDRSK